MTFMTSTSFFFFKSDLVDDYIYIYMGNNSYYNGSDLCLLSNVNLPLPSLRLFKERGKKPKPQYSL